MVSVRSGNHVKMMQVRNEARYEKTVCKPWRGLGRLLSIISKCFYGWVIGVWGNFDGLVNLDVRRTSAQRTATQKLGTPHREYETAPWTTSIDHDYMKRATAFNKRTSIAKREWASISITFAIAAAAWVHVRAPLEELIEALRDAVSEVLAVDSKTPRRRRFRDLH